MSVESTENDVKETHMDVLQIDGLTKRFGPVTAVYAVDLPGQPGLSAPDRPRRGRQRYAGCSPISSRI